MVSGIPHVPLDRTARVLAGVGTSCDHEPTTAAAEYGQLIGRHERFLRKTT